MRFPAFLRSGISTASSGWKGASRVRARIQTVLLVLVILNGVLLFLFFRPPGRSLVERQDESQRIRARREAALGSVEQMRSLRTKLQGAIQNGLEFSQKNFLPRKTAFSTMLADLEELASQSRLKPTGVSYQLKEETDQPGWVNVEVTVTVEGEYGDLVHFINRIEQSQLFWIINSLNVSGSPTKVLRLNLQMGTYFVPS